MEKVGRKYARQTSAIPFFDLGKQPKTANGCKMRLGIVYFRRDHEEVNLIFSIIPSLFLWTRLQKEKWSGTSYQSL